MNDLSALVKKISSDSAFLKELAAAPEATIKKYNYQVSDSALNSIKGMDEAGIRELAANFDSDKAAC
jgi:hypothetical protein